MILEDPGIYGIGAAFALNLTLFLLFFIGFTVLRRVRSRQIDGQFRKPVNAVYSESDTPLIELLRKVYSTDLGEIYDLCGLEAYMYIVLHKYIIVTLSVICFYGLFVLVPVYLKGHNEEPNELEKMGISHVLNEDEYMAPVLVFYVFYSVLGYILVYTVLKKVDAKMLPTAVPLHRYAVEIKGIPKRLPPAVATQKLSELLLTHLKEEVAFVYVVPDYTEAYQWYLKMQATVTKLQAHKDHMSEGKPRMEIRKKYLTCKVDAIDYYSEKIHSYNEEYYQCLPKGLERNTGFAYAICYTPSYADAVLRAIPRAYNELKSFLWSVKPAPAPEEIKWENMKANYLILRGRKVCMTLGFMVLFFLVLTPTAFSSTINVILEDIGASVMIEGFLSQYLPTIVLLFYQAVVLKQSIIYLVSKEKHTCRSSETLSCTIKYLLFMGFYTFIYQMVGIQGLTLVSDLFTGEIAPWREKLATSLIFSGEFYTIYIIQQTFISMGAELLQFDKLLYTRLQLVLASTEKEKTLAYQAYPFFFGYEFPAALTAFMVILAFSVSYPIITFFGLMYFVVRVRARQLCVHKYVILCVYTCDKSSTGVRLTNSCLQSLVTSVFMFQFLTASVILLNISEAYMQITGSLWTVSLLIFAVLFFKARTIMHTASSMLPDQERESTLGHLLDNPYMHPIERLESKQF